MSMQGDPLVRSALEKQVDDPGILVDAQDVRGGVIAPGTAVKNPEAFRALAECRPQA